MRKKLLTALFVVCSVALAAVFCFAGCGDGGKDGGKMSKESWNEIFDQISNDNVGSYTITIGEVGSREKDNTLCYADFNKGVAYTKNIRLNDGAVTVAEQYAVKRNNRMYMCQSFGQGWSAYSYPMNGDWGDFTAKNYFIFNIGHSDALSYIQSAGTKYLLFDYDSKTKTYVNNLNGSKLKFDENTITYWYDSTVEEPTVLTNWGNTFLTIPTEVDNAIKTAINYGD